MGKQLNIKSETLYAKVEELASLTGASLTGAVETAVDEKLDAERRKRDRDALVTDLLAIGTKFRAKLGTPLSAQEIDDFLYDENGLPH
jgi:antitoxin VapB